MITSAFTCTGPYAVLIMLGIKCVENRSVMPVPAKGMPPDLAVQVSAADALAACVGDPSTTVVQPSEVFAAAYGNVGSSLA